MDPAELQKQSGHHASNEYLEHVKEALMNGMKDIDELLSVAKYNLRGEHCGKIVGKPKKPNLIHERGIAASEKVREQMRKAFNSTLELLNSEKQPPIAETNNLNNKEQPLKKSEEVNPNKSLSVETIKIDTILIKSPMLNDDCYAKMRELMNEGYTLLADLSSCDKAKTAFLMANKNDLDSLE